MRRCGDGDPCDHSGLSVMVGGMQNRSTRAGLVFDSDFPCGVEVTPAGVGVAATALRRIKLWSGCLQFTGAPGERVMVIGHIMSRARAVGGEGIRPWDRFAPCDQNVQSAQPRMKLAITSCLVPGDVIIDADSAISMPAGNMEIDLLMPSDWAVLGTFNITPGTFVSTQLIVRACPPINGWCPDGVLSEWLPLDAEVPGARVLVRPRRARTLAVQAAGAAGPPFGPIAVNVEWRDTLTTAMAATTFTATTQQTVEPFGDAPFVGVNPAATGFAMLRWGIR